MFAAGRCTSSHQTRTGLSCYLSSTCSESVCWPCQLKAAETEMDVLAVVGGISLHEHIYLYFTAAGASGHFHRHASAKLNLNPSARVANS